MGVNQAIQTLLWGALAVAAIMVLVAAVRRAKPKEQINSTAESNELSGDAGQRLRELSVGPRTTQQISNPDNALERTMLIDAIERKFQQAGGEMPDSIRKMLDERTVDEIKESLANIL